MAERSTAAVGVAETGDEEQPLTTRTDEASAGSGIDGHGDGDQSPVGTRADTGTDGSGSDSNSNSNSDGGSAGAGPAGTGGRTVPKADGTKRTKGAKRAKAAEDSPSGPDGVDGTGGVRAAEGAEGGRTANGAKRVNGAGNVNAKSAKVAKGARGVGGARVGDRPARPEDTAALDPAEIEAVSLDTAPMPAVVDDGGVAPATDEVLLTAPEPGTMTVLEALMADVPAPAKPPAADDAPVGVAPAVTPAGATTADATTVDATTSEATTVAAATAAEAPTAVAPPVVAATAASGAASGETPGRGTTGTTDRPGTGTAAGDAPAGSASEGSASGGRADRTASPDAPGRPPRGPRPARADRTGPGAGTPGLPADTPPPPELHSGHKLARRYRLEECVTRLDGFSSWRAVDEKLRRAVGVHVLPAGHPRARPVLSAARSSALLGDPRFVQVLDAVEDQELVYVVHEWLPDATPLTELLTAGPLPPHDAYQLVSQLSQALSAAHREGLAHLRLTPATVLRTASGQYRIRGLAVNAALRGITSDTPQRDDTEAIGALLYAALTQRWPYEEDAYGLAGVGTLAKGTLVAPDQVRAGVHRGLSQLAMRALVNDGATASSEEQPCATPEELARAVTTLPRIKAPEPSFGPPPPYQRTTFSQGPYGPGGAGPALPGRGGPGGPAAEPPAPPALPGRTGKAIKWGVSALLIAALGLGSWQVADTLLKGGGGSHGTQSSRLNAQENSHPATGHPVRIVSAKDFDPAPGGNGSENPGEVPDAYDGAATTYWGTQNYYGQPDFGNLKPGVGLVLDLGRTQQVSSVKVDFIGSTSAEFLAAPRSTTGMPTALSGFRKVSGGTGEHLTLRARKPIETRFVLVWLTKLPLSQDGNYRGRVTEVHVLS